MAFQHLAFMTFAVTFFCYWILQPKFKPSQIPTIPLLTTIYYNFQGLGKTAFYDKCLRALSEKYGAVQHWTDGHWMILVTRPQYLNQIFKSENIFTKAGSVKRAPGSVHAHLFGENIIDSHGDTWRRFSTIIRPAIQRPLTIDSICEISSKLGDILIEEQRRISSKKGLALDFPLQRWAISIYGRYFLDFDLEDWDYPNSSLHAVVSDIKTGLIDHFLVNFPACEKLHWLFPSVPSAFQTIDGLEAILDNAAEKAEKDCQANPDRNKLIHVLTRARQAGLLSTYQFRSNMKQLFMAGHENAQLALKAAMCMLADHPDIQARLRSEVMTSLPLDYSLDEVNSLPLATAVVYEILRLYPPLAQLSNRVTSEATYLGEDIQIPRGTWVAWSAYGVQTNQDVWGPKAHQFMPDRWGSTIFDIDKKFRREQSRGAFVPFTSHTRRCLGSNFAVTQIKVALCELVRKVKWTKSYYSGSKSSTTSIPTITPQNYRLIFEEVNRD